MMNFEEGIERFDDMKSHDEIRKKYDIFRTFGLVFYLKNNIKKIRLTEREVRFRV